MTQINSLNGNINKSAVDTKPKQVMDEEDNEPFTDKRIITIALVNNYSNYRKANFKTMGPRKQSVGSSITSSKELSSNKEEIETYFPSLIGLSPNNPDFVTKVKTWLSNISFTVGEDDKKLNASFIYNHKSDYLKIKKQEDKIEEDYEKISRNDVSAIKKALNKKIYELNKLESTKCKYGRPENVEEYLMYRHCLLYKDVAKDLSLINSDPSIRFYIKDENKEKEKQIKLTEERKTAMTKFVELNSSEKKFNDVYINIITYLKYDLSNYITKSNNEKVALVIDFVNNNPSKFNKIINDKNNSIKAFIEILIIRGELVRSDFNQQIITAEGNFIGSNMNEAIAYFNNPNNKGTYEMYKNKLTAI